ncbi:MAG: B12-binding domain-containing protein [Thermodesulfobacteriota bacterium]
MGKNDILELLKNQIVALDKEAVTANTTEILEEGVSPFDIIEYGLLPGLNIIGEKFENDEVFLPELMRAAETFQSAMAILQPKIQELGGPTKKKGIIVIGTVKGDLHYIGKNIVRLLLETSGYEVHDLGVDIDIFKFIDTATQFRADVIALSALLTTTLVGQKDLIEALTGMGKRDQYKVIVGGSAVTRAWADEIGADGYGETAHQAVELVNTLVE